MNKTSYKFRVKGRNGDGTQTDWISLGTQNTKTRCPDCSGDSRVIENVTFISGTVCECVCTTSLTIGAGVIVQAGATFTFMAPKVCVTSGFHAQNGSTVFIKQE